MKSDDIHILKANTNKIMWPLDREYKNAYWCEKCEIYHVFTVKIGEMVQYDDTVVE